jgi:hypothetical protein
MLDEFIELLSKEQKNQIEDNCPLDFSQVTTLLQLVNSMSRRVVRIEKVMYAIAVIFILNTFALATSDDVNSYTDKVVAKIRSLNDMYCSEDNAGLRKVVIAIIKAEIPSYPEGGLCDAEHSVEKFLKKG